MTGTPGPPRPRKAAPPKAAAAKATPPKAAAPPKSAAPRAATARAARAKPAGALSTETTPVPLVVTPEDLEIPAGLPELTFPSSAARDFEEQAAQRRRRRLRGEGIGAAVVLVVSGGLAAATHTPSMLVLGAIAVGALGAYELLVTNFE